MTKTTLPSYSRGTPVTKGDLATALDKLSLCPIIASLSPSDFELLKGEISILSFKTNSTIVKFGEAADSFFILIKGLLLSRRTNCLGKALNLNLIYPGDLFGELALICGTPRSADIIAQERSILAQISHRSFSQLMYKSSTFSQAILKRTAQIALQNTEKLHEISFLDLNERLLQTLIRAATPIEVGGKEVLVVREIPRRQTLANFLSCTREAVSRGLKYLDEVGTIELLDGRIIIK